MAVNHFVGLAFITSALLPANCSRRIVATGGRPEPNTVVAKIPMWLLLAICSLLQWGIGNVLVKKGLDTVTATGVTLLFPLTRAIVWLPYIALAGFWVDNPLLIALVALVYCAGMVLYYEALAAGEVSIAATLPAAYPVVTVILAAVFLHEPTTVLQKVCIVGVVIGITLTGLNLAADQRLLRITRSMGYALLAMFLFGVQEFLTKISITGTGVAGFMLIFLAVQLPVFVAYAAIRRKSMSLGRLPSFLWVVLGLLLFSAGYITYLLAMELQNVSIVSPVAAGYPVAVIILAHFLLGEVLKPTQLIGLAIVIGSVVGLSL